jgi:hypothetical protein
MKTTPLTHIRSFTFQGVPILTAITPPDDQTLKQMTAAQILARVQIYYNNDGELLPVDIHPRNTEEFMSKYMTVLTNDIHLNQEGGNTL